MTIVSRLNRWRRSITARFVPGAEESGVALLTAIFFMVFSAGLSVVVLSAVLSQAAPALTAAKNTRTVYAAQAGLQAALGIIRSVAAAPEPLTGQVFGAPGSLPCSSTGSVVTGQVSATGPGAYYAVTIDYFTADPANTTPAWRASNRISCSALLGSTPTVPKYAYVYSGGKDAAAPVLPTAGDRRLSAIYKFKVSNVNIAGGPIYNSNGLYCLEAVTATAGSEVKFVSASPCPNGSLNLWTYAADYQLELSSTTVGGAPGLCITGGPITSGDTTTRKATLQPCLLPADPLRWNQLWSWTGDYSWRGQKNPVADGPSNFCLSPNVANGSVPSWLYARNGCNGQFAPSLSVGAGAAGYATHQLVNYQEFGRCTDVTDENINKEFMISYPCKQDPTGTGTYLRWNHKWYYSEPPTGSSTLGPQQVYVFDSGGTKRCLTAVSGVADLTFKSCATSGTVQNQQKWTRVRDTGDYSSSYLLIDYYGRCMFTDTSSPFATFYSKVRVTACNGSLAQKWNAPPTYVDSTFGGYREVAG